MYINIHTFHRVKGAMDLCLSSCEDSDAEEERSDALDDAIRDVTGWVDLENANNVPNLSIKNIHQYFINRKYVRNK